jgi:hypothetical protein
MNFKARKLVFSDDDIFTNTAGRPNEADGD